MRRVHFFHRGTRSAIALAFALSVLPCSKSFAATDWTPIQTALGANGVEMPGSVLRFELVRQDLTITINGTKLPANEVAEVANGYLGFKEVHGSGSFFVDGSLPALEGEVTALQL
ncbi:MAG: hypothetical protein JOY95_07845 [Silvibacterium sp.]|nr:hypothetical protein [Silvibacterium sp.]